MADAGKTHSVKLGGKYYIVEKHVKEAQDSFVPRYSVSDIPQDRDFSVLNRWQTKSCHLGEGQDNMDITDEDVSVYRYKTSSGIDVSEKHEITTLYSVAQSKASANATALPLIQVGTMLAIADGTNVYLFNGAWGSASASGFSATNIRELASDGINLYACDSATAMIRKGVITDVNTITWSDFSAIKGENLLWYNNYLFVSGDIAGGEKFYQLDTSGTEAYSYPGTGAILEDVVAIEAYNGDVYFGGSNVAGSSKLWKFDGTDTVEITSHVPKGDNLLSLRSAMGRLWIGTNRQTGTAEWEGHLYSWDGNSITHHWKIDVETAAKNYGIYVIGHFGTNIYFGWNNLTGLGRYDLKEGGVSRSIVAPAAAVNQVVTAIVPWRNKLYFSILTKGIYAEGATHEASANLSSSFNNLNTVHKKLWPTAEIRTETLGTSDTVEFQYTTDKGDQYISAGTMSQVATKYKADLIPASATPAWTKSGSATTEEISPTGILHIDDTTSLYYYRTEAGISNATGSCLQVKGKMVAGSKIELRIYDGTKLAQVYFRGTDVLLLNSAGGTQGIVNVDSTSNYNTVRVTMKANVVKVYVNGGLVITGAATDTTATTQMRFDVETPAASYDVYIDHVYYSLTGAHSPDDNDLTDTYYEVDLPNVVADSLGYKLVLTNTSGNLVVLPVSVRSIPLMSNKKAWELTIKATDYPEGLNASHGTNKSGEDYMSDLWAAQGGRQILEFEDIDSTTYNVIIIKGPSQELMGRQKKGSLESLMTLTLWEV